MGCSRTLLDVVDLDELPGIVWKTFHVILIFPTARELVWSYSTHVAPVQGGV